MNYFKIFTINEHIFQFADPLGVLATLVVGSKKALLFDTCYGIGSLKNEITKITNLPIIVVNSHGHMDHTCGNYEFDEVYINERDIPLCIEHNSLSWRKLNLQNAISNALLPKDFDESKYLNSLQMIHILPMPYTFDLGNLNLEVIDLAGHTKGSIGLLIKELNILLVSDAICPYVWLFLNESTSLNEYVKMLNKTINLNFDYFLVGHGAGLLPKERMIDFCKVAKNVDTTKAVKVSFKNFDHLNSYCYNMEMLNNSYDYTNDITYDQKSCGIVFNPDKL